MQMLLKNFGMGRAIYRRYLNKQTHKGRVNSYTHKSFIKPVSKT